MDQLETASDSQLVMAAVVFSDAVGFSARMAVDENRTLRLVERDLTLMTEICQRQGGRFSNPREMGY